MIRTILHHLSLSPHNQIDKQITDELKTYIFTMNSETMTSIMDLCAYHGAASDFGMSNMQIVRDILKELEKAKMQTFPDYSIDLDATNNTYTWAALSYEYDYVTELFEMLTYLEDHEQIPYKLAMHHRDKNRELQYMIFFPNPQDISLALLKFPKHHVKYLKENAIKYNNDYIQFIRT